MEPMTFKNEMNENYSKMESMLSSPVHLRFSCFPCLFCFFFRHLYFGWCHHLNSKSGFDYEEEGLRLDIYVDLLLQCVCNILSPVP